MVFRRRKDDTMYPCYGDLAGLNCLRATIQSGPTWYEEYHPLDGR